MATDLNKNENIHRLSDFIVYALRFLFTSILVLSHAAKQRTSRGLRFILWFGWDECIAETLIYCVFFTKLESANTEEESLSIRNVLR